MIAATRSKAVCQSTPCRPRFSVQAAEGRIKFDVDGTSMRWNFSEAGARINRALISVCHMMGLTDVKQFGDPAFASEPDGMKPLPILAG